MVIFHSYVSLPEGSFHEFYGCPVNRRSSHVDQVPGDFHLVGPWRSEDEPASSSRAIPSYEVLRYGYGSIPIDTFLVGWTSIYQLFWGSLGTRVLTHPHIFLGPDFQMIQFWRKTGCSSCSLPSPRWQGRHVSCGYGRCPFPNGWLSNHDQSNPPNNYVGFELQRVKQW